MDEFLTGTKVALEDASYNLGPLEHDKDRDDLEQVPGVIYGVEFLVRGAELGEAVVSSRLRNIYDNITGFDWQPQPGHPLEILETAIVSAPVRIAYPLRPIVLPSPDRFGYGKHCVVPLLAL